MRSRVSLVLVAVTGVVIAICEFESAAAVSRWDTSDVGRTASLNASLLPQPLPADQRALITVRVEAGGNVRTYRYWIAPQREQPRETLRYETVQVDPGAAGMDRQPDPETVHAVH